MSSLDAIPSRYSVPNPRWTSVTIERLKCDTLGCHFGVFFAAGRWKLASFTDAVAVVLHLFPVFQVHGPDVALEQARGVGNRVRPCAADTRAVESDSSLPSRTRVLLRSRPGNRLPSSPFAFLIRNGDVEALVVDVNQRPEGGKRRDTDQSCLGLPRSWQEIKTYS